MTEQQDYKIFRSNVITMGDRIDRVENALVAGMPDVNFCANCVECWIELKSPTEPQRDRTPLFGSNHKISQDQMNWMKRQIDAKGRAYFLISTNKRWILINGCFADLINTMPVNRIVDNCAWTTLKPVRDKTEWASLRECLIR